MKVLIRFGFKKVRHVYPIFMGVHLQGGVGFALQFIFFGCLPGSEYFLGFLLGMISFLGPLLISILEALTIPSSIFRGGGNTDTGVMAKLFSC